MNADKYYSLFVEAGIIDKVKIWLDDNPPPENWESTKWAWAYTEMWLGAYDYTAVQGAKDRLDPAYDFS